MIAKELISEGDCVAIIPRSALLSCANSDIKDLVKEDKELSKLGPSSWVPLLLTLASEYSFKVCYELA